MPLLALLKTKPLLCSLAGAGTVAAPIAAICYAVNTFSTTPKHTYSPPTFDNLSTDSKLSVIDQKPSGCFNSFFPGVKIGDETNTGHDGNIADETIDDGKLIGCALMKLDYTNSNQFAFSAEITAKNGTHGWAIKIYLQPKNTSESEDSNDTYRFTYNIVFLKRNSDTKKWSVDGGIYLELSSPGDPTANISFSDKTLITNGNRDSAISETPKSWFATWEESSDSGAKEIFDDIKVNYDNTNTLYLGQPSSASNTHCSSSAGTGNSVNCDCVPSTTMDPKNKYENHKWAGDVSVSIQDLCAKYKAQLKDRKGKWTWHDNPETFCSDLQTNSASDSSKRHKLNNYCYSYR